MPYWWRWRQPVKLTVTAPTSSTKAFGLDELSWKNVCWSTCQSHLGDASTTKTVKGVKLHPCLKSSFLKCTDFKIRGCPRKIPPSLWLTVRYELLENGFILSGQHAGSQLLAETCSDTLDRPPYSSDVVPCNFFFLPFCLKSCLPSRNLNSNLLKFWRRNQQSFRGNLQNKSVWGALISERSSVSVLKGNI